MLNMQRLNLKNKKILLICPMFFGYESEIINEIKKNGASVDWMADRPFNSHLFRALTRSVPTVAECQARKFYNEKLTKFGRSAYDYVFVVNGQTLSRKFLDELRVSYPAASFVLYLWDSVYNRPNSVRLLSGFDKVMTFDKRDANKFSLNFRPLFYSDGFKVDKRPVCKYDLSFVATIHSDRYSVVNKIKEGLPDRLQMYCYLYIQAKWVYFYRKLTDASFKGAKLSDFEYRGLGKSQLYQIFFDSSCILDIEHSEQAGLTMRTFETLGAEKKLITTNQDVANYDFFSPENICVIDRSAPKIPDRFWDSPYKKIPSDLYYKYSISGWLDDVFAS